VERAALGITAHDATAEDAAYVGLPEIRGVLVEDFSSPDSPAKRAGVQPGDVIIAVDGKPVDYVAQLQEAVAFRKPGDVVSVEVARKGGQRAALRVTLQRADAERTAGADTAGAGPARGERGGRAGGALPALGISALSSDDAAARGLELPADVRGVVVADVADAGPASGRLFAPEAGGPDVILSVEGTAVRTPPELRDALRAHKPGDIVTLRVYNVPFKTRRIERVRLGEAAGR
jgi:serine protease Do